MRPYTRPARNDVYSDAQEQERIRIESEMARQIDPLTFDTQSTASSLEYPRHIPPASYSPRLDAFHSFSPHNNDHDLSELDFRHRQSHDLGSYRTTDDSVARHGETLSTAHHHASAITLGAGLGGRTPTASSTSEFDPERRVPDLLGNNSLLNPLRRTSRKPVVDDSYSGLNSKSYNTLEPIIVEDTAELDRAMESGQLDVPQTTTAQPHHDDFHDGSYTESEDESMSQRSDVPPVEQPSNISHLRRSDFQRPGNPVNRSTYPINNNSNHHPRRPGHAQEELRTKASVPLSFPRDTNSKIHLPDITGLTSAIATPAKAGRRYRAVPDRSAEASLVQESIEALAMKLGQLENENITSRRRVRELELELENCRADVVRERSRVETEMMRQRAGADRKGKGRANAMIAPGPEGLHMWEARYKEVLETKKALEGLIMSLRAQLAQMTNALDSHKQTIAELRTLRAEDEAEIMMRSREVEELHAEVDRLSAEVRRLRGIIEDNVRERRAATDRRGPTDHQQPMKDMREVSQYSQFPSPPLSPTPSSPSPSPSPLREDAPSPPPVPQTRGAPSMRPASRMEKMQMRATQPDRNREDPEPQSHAATAGSPTRRFLSVAELERIESDIEDRRSIRSEYAAPRRRAKAPATRQPQQQPQRQQQVPQPHRQQQVPQQPHRQPRAQPQAQPRRQPPQPQQDFDHSFAAINEDEDDGAFSRPPGRLEKLFFNLPPHNEATCKTCRRRAESGPPGSGKAQRTRARDGAPNMTIPELVAKAEARVRSGLEHQEHSGEEDEDEIPPQAVLARVLRECEDDFSHYKSIYLELAQQYGAMDPASNAAKRNVLAMHLKEVIEVLEQKGDQIAGMYDLLSVRPNSARVGGGKYVD